MTIDQSINKFESSKTVNVVPLGAFTYLTYCLPVTLGLFEPQYALFLIDNLYRTFTNV